jgi:hypothetical protein
MVGALVVMVGAVMSQPIPIIPRLVLIVSPLLLFLAMGGARAVAGRARSFICAAVSSGSASP